MNDYWRNTEHGEPPFKQGDIVRHIGGQLGIVVEVKCAECGFPHGFVPAYWYVSCERLLGGKHTFWDTELRKVGHVED